MKTRYAIAVSECPPQRPALAAPSLYEAYKEMLEVGTAQRGSLIPSRLWRAGVLGDPRVFRGAPVASSKIKASAVLLWDWSFSQRQDQEVLAVGLTSIAQALSLLRFRVWAGAYTSSADIRLETGEERSAVERLLGQYGCAIAVTQGWGESFDARRVATLRDFSMGGTPTGPALHYLRRRVLPYSGGGRKALVVLSTDGQADDPYYQQREVKAISGLQDVTLVNIYCGDDENLLARTRKEFPHCFWALERGRIPDAFAHTLRAFRGGL